MMDQSLAPVKEHERLLSLDEFVRLYETEGPFEFIDGEFIPVSPVVAGHGNRARILYNAVDAFTRQHQLGTVYFKLAYVLTYNTKWVKGSREPDLMFYRADRLAAYQSEHPDWENKPFMLVPDLVVEIISATDLYTEVEAKIQRYLADGVAWVWVLNPRLKQMRVRSQAEERTLSLEDTLTAPDILPDFALPIRMLFAG
jgi:Uma2 family endonuclease